ncbi:MAG: sodium/proton-translocating pyrophosphatase, partial [Actinomycetota bacterium]
MNPEVWLYVAIAMGVAALILAAVYGRQVIAVSPGNDRMVELMTAIREGSMAFMKREYMAIAGFVAIMAVLIFVLLDWGRPWGAV